MELPLRIIRRSAGFIPFSILLFVLGALFFYESFYVHDFEYGTLVLLQSTFLLFELNHLNLLSFVDFLGSFFITVLI